VLTRKQFLATGAALTLTGCAEIPSQFRPRLRTLTPEAGPFQIPTSDSVDLSSHLLSRLTFGPRGSDYARLAAIGPARYLDEQLYPESIDDSDLDAAVRRIESLSSPAGEMFEYKEKVLLADMTRAALLRAVWSKRQLYERMVHFWTDHFNIDSSKGDCKWLKASDDRDVIRRHALGRFPDLLRASAMSPAMLWYLDGRVYRKQSPNDKHNENYARELLELHTLGVHSGYTQRDVMEVARCLTGWTVRSVKQFNKGRVEFHSYAHDNGPKTVLGHDIPAGLGAQDFDRVLDIVALHPATAQHLATKLCRHFIADDPPDTAVATVERAFLATHGDIRATTRALFATTEFQNARRTKLKRPCHFIASALRVTQADIGAGPALFDYLVRMGHAPFQYPTPEGYSDRSVHWTGTLLWRWKFAVALSRNQIRATTVNVQRCVSDCGSPAAFAAHVLGRRPTPDELSPTADPHDQLALLLASPEFQRC
jgi:uncharacterized protein (DUF1800 family)